MVVICKFSFILGRQFLQKKKPNFAYFSKTSNGGNWFCPPVYVIVGGGGVNNRSNGKPQPVLYSLGELLLISGVGVCSDLPKKDRPVTISRIVIVPAKVSILQ